MGFTKTAAVEYARKNVRVNAICPYFSLTPLVTQNNLIERKDQLEAASPMKRLAEPDEVVAAILALLTVLADLPGGRHVLDGEVCVLDDYGRSDFDRLHARAKRRGFPAGADPVVFCAFDLLVHQGLDVRALPLKTRKRRLAQLLRRQRPSVLLVDGIAERGTWLFIQALELKLEGIVSKRLDSEYESGVRSRAWVKVKRPGAVPAERFRRGVGSNR